MSKANSLLSVLLTIVSVSLTGKNHPILIPENLQLQDYTFLRDTKAVPDKRLVLPVAQKVETGEQYFPLGEELCHMRRGPTGITGH